MKRTLKISGKWQSNKKVPAITLQGIYLNEFDFKIGETVTVDISENLIKIQKRTPEEILTAMIKENPHLGTLVQKLNCVPCE